jgi:hypothetical protein
MPHKLNDHVTDVQRQASELASLISTGISTGKAFCVNMKFLPDYSDTSRLNPMPANRTRWRNRFQAQLRPPSFPFLRPLSQSPFCVIASLESTPLCRRDDLAERRLPYPFRSSASDLCFQWTGMQHCGAFPNQENPRNYTSRTVW